MASPLSGIAAITLSSRPTQHTEQEEAPQSNHPPKSPLSSSSSSTYSYSTYQNEIYKLSFTCQKPPLPTIPSTWSTAARSALTPEAWSYLEGGGGTSSTMHANRTAFDRWKLIPKMLTGNNIRNLKTELFGIEHASPVIMAPVGVNGIFHEDAECGVARACRRVGVGYTVSTAASRSIEDIAATVDNGDLGSLDNASGESKEKGQMWFQLYWPRKQDDDVTLSLLKRAWDVGCRVLIITLDTWVLGWRPADLENTYIPFFHGTGCQIGFSDPVFQRKYHILSSGKPIEDDITAASLAWLQTAFSGTSRSWSDLSFLRENWNGALVAKGIQSPQDAINAVNAGCDGIVVSNHGGRQYDGASGSLSVLPDIAEAMRTCKTLAGKDVTVLFDSGIRCGADILKALALGAHAVLLGRPVIYGLAAAGEAGAEHVLRCLLADLDLNLALLGHTSTKDLGRGDLRFEPWG